MTMQHNIDIFRRSSGGICTSRNLKPSRVRSTISGQSSFQSQFPRTTVSGGPIASSSSVIVGSQTSPRCQISSALARKIDNLLRQFVMGVSEDEDRALHSLQNRG